MGTAPVLAAPTFLACAGAGFTEITAEHLLVLFARHMSLLAIAPQFEVKPRLEAHALAFRAAAGVGNEALVTLAFDAMAVGELGRLDGLLAFEGGALFADAHVEVVARAFEIGDGALLARDLAGEALLEADNGGKQAFEIALSLKRGDLA